MRTILTILCVIACVAARAENLSAKDGTVYRNVTIVSANPDHMLIVHDGGGCQVLFKDLVADSLTAEQRKTVEQELRYYVERTERKEKVRLEREAFETAQREKGLVEFEGCWVSPLGREEILLNREERKLDLERKRIELAKERAELEKEKLQTETARYLLEGESRGSTTITYGYYSPYRRDCIPSLPCHHRPSCYKMPRVQSRPRTHSSGTIYYKPEDNPYISFEGVSDYNRGPFKR